MIPQKPNIKYGDPYPTNRGWCVMRPNGYEELLVSYPNLLDAMNAQQGQAASNEPKPIVPDAEDGGVVVSEPETVSEEPVLAGIEESEPVVEQEQQELNDVAVDDVAVDEVVSPAKYTHEDLSSLSMPDLRKIGNQFGVKDNKKDELINKIIAAQS